MIIKIVGIRTEVKGEPFGWFPRITVEYTDGTSRVWWFVEDVYPCYGAAIDAGKEILRYLEY